MKKKNIYPRKIIHFAKYSSKFHGGIENVVKNSIDCTSSKNFSVKSVSFCDSHNTFIYKNYTELTYKPLFKLFSQPFSFKYFLSCIINGNMSNIVHFHFPNIVAILSIFFIKKDIKIVVHWHSDVVNQKLLSYLVYPLQVYLLYRSHKIICTSHNYFNHSKILQLFYSKVTIIPICIPDPSLKYKSNKINFNQLPFSFNKRIILSVGRLVDYKGFQSLIISFKKSKTDCILVIVGSGPLYLQLLKIIENENLNNCVFILRNVDDATLKLLFRKSFMFCLASINKSEAFGVVLLEALAFGLPIITYNLEQSGVSWVNKNNYCGIQVPTNDINKFASAISKVVQNKSLWKYFSKNARSRYLDEFTLQNYKSSLLSLYESFFDF